DERHRPDASFIIHLLGYLHETQLQFGDWWFDVRVRISKDSLSSCTKTNEHFVSHAYEAWQKWPPRVRVRFANILFMFNRALSYEWDWEHFNIQYMVFDALYITAAELNLITKVKSHKARLSHTCKSLGLLEEPDRFKEFVRLRNDLFHEALWDNGQPGTA